MKKVLFILVFLFGIVSHNAQAQTVDTGAIISNFKKTNPEYNALLNQKTAATQTPTAAPRQNTPCCNCPISKTEKVVAFLPVVLFLLVMMVIFSTLRKSGYKISDALKENEPVTITKPAATADGASTTETIQPNSSSRLIAFLTGMTTLVILACVTTYWMYKSFVCSQPIDMSSLTTVFITLGLGIVPYGANKIAGAFKG